MCIQLYTNMCIISKHVYYNQICILFIRIDIFLRGKHIFPYISSSLLVGRKLAYLILSCCFRPTIQYTAKSFLIYGLQMRKWIETNHVLFLQLRSRLRSLTTANHDSRSRLRKGLQLHLSFYFFLAELPLPLVTGWSIFSHGWSKNLSMKGINDMEFDWM